MRGSDADAQNLLTIGRTAIDKSSQLEGTQVSFPIKLFAYASSQDFLPAAQKESKATDPGLLGQANGPDIVLFWAPSLQGEAEDTVRHELTHLVTGEEVKGGFSDLRLLEHVEIKGATTIAMIQRARHAITARSDALDHYLASSQRNASSRASRSRSGRVCAFISASVKRCVMC